MPWLQSTAIAFGVALATSIATVSLGFAQDDAPDVATRVLIVTGHDPSHDWRSTTPVLQMMLRQDHRLKVDVLC